MLAMTLWLLWLYLVIGKAHIWSWLFSALSYEEESGNCCSGVGGFELYLVIGEAYIWSWLFSALSYEEESDNFSFVDYDGYDTMTTMIVLGHRRGLYLKLVIFSFILWRGEW